MGILLLGEQPKPASPLATPEPVRGGAYTEALVGTFQRLNPLLVFYNQADRDVSRLIFSGLVSFDSRGIPQPDLAESWGASKDGTLFNVTLRKGLRWQDGKPLTADDVLFTIDLMRNGGTVVPKDLQEFWKGVDAVVLSESVLQFRLPEPFAPFPNYLNFGILPKHLLDGKSTDDLVNAPFNLAPIGSGPYKFSRMIVENDQIVGVALSLSSQYYLPKPYIEELVFRYYPNSEAALGAYNDGQVQGMGQVTGDILPDVLRNTNLNVYTMRQPMLTMVLFNLNNPDVIFLQDKNVRRALLEGINRQKLIDQFLQGQAVIANGPILAGSWAYYSGSSSTAYNPTDSLVLLKKAGFSLANKTDTVLTKGEVKLSFTLLYPETDLYRQVAEAIQAGWRDLGVDVNLESVPYDSLVSDRLASRTYQAALVDLNLNNSPDPDPYPFWDQAQAGSGQNYTQWDSRMASEYLEQARIHVDLADRARYYRNFQVVFSEELPALPLYNPVYTYAVDQKIQGVRIGPFFDPSDRFNTIAEWFLAGRPKNTQPAAETPTAQK